MLRGLPAASWTIKATAMSLGILLLATPSSVAIEQATASTDTLAAGAAECSQESAPADMATDVAIGCGHEVLIADALTEWSTPYATPTGNVRVDYRSSAVRQDSDGDGNWGEVDVAISDVPSVGRVDEVPEGMLAVDGGVEPIWLNPGGAAGADLPLAIVGDSDERVSMFSETLPVTGPITVDDRRVTYDLGQGVDLVVTVNAEGTIVTPVVRVSDETALAHLSDELLSGAEQRAGAMELSFPLEVSDGLDVVGTTMGFEVHDAAGEIAFESGPVIMWDSAGELDWDQVGTAEPGAVDGVPGATAASVAESSGDDRLAGPAPGDRAEPMDVSVSDDVVTVAPDPELLMNPDLQYPLHLDPAIGASTPARWATVHSSWPSNVDWRKEGTQSLGFCDYSRAPECGRDNKDRLFWYFSRLRQGSDGVWLKNLSGSEILDATFRVYGTHSWDCSARRVELYGTDIFTTSLSWNNQPRWRSLQDAHTVSHKSACDNRRWIEFDVTPRVRTAANADVSYLALGMRAGSETSMTWWKRYRAYDARLSIEFDRAPLPPTRAQSKMRASADAALQPCNDYTNRYYVRSTRPVLRARGTEPDGTSQVQVRFRIQVPATDKTVWTSSWTSPATASTWGERRVSGAAGLRSGQTYRWQAKVRSKDAKTGHLATTAWSKSPWCHFIPDTEYPNPPLVSSSNYPHREVAGGLGTPAKFVIDANGSSDVARFEYSYNNQTFNKSAAASSGKASLTVSVARPGLNYAVVRSRDKAGLISDTTRYEFYVGFPFASAHWQFNDEGWAASTPRTADNTESAATGPLELSDSVTWGPGVSPDALFPPSGVPGSDPASRVPDGALVFDGATDVARAQGPAIDGTESFTVSAFLRADEIGSSAAAVSQEPLPGATTEDGNAWSSFHLGYSSSADCPTEDQAPCWSFWHVLSEDDGPTNTIARTPVPVVEGEWTHIVGVYDAANKTLQSYACQGTAKPYAGPQASKISSFTDLEPGWKPWNAAGPLRLGSGVRNGTPVWPFGGAVDEVRVYAGQVVDTEKLSDICTGADVP